MSTLNELRAIDTALRDTLEDCNAVMLSPPAETIKGVPQRIEETVSTATANGYNTGREDGYSHGFGDGIEQGVGQGKQAAYDEFWDAYQNHGVYQNCLYKFAGSSWNDTAYNPKYPLVVYQNALRMYSYSYVTDTKVDIDISSVGANSNNMFEYSKLVTIQKFKVSATNVFSGSFTGCNQLQNIVFEGEIGKSINFQSCPLSVASMKSIIACLKDFTGTADEYSCTLTFSDACWVALAADSNAPDGSPWGEYVQSLGWNI